MQFSYCPEVMRGLLITCLRQAASLCWHHGLNKYSITWCFYTTGANELCESRGGRPGLLVPNSLHGLCGRKPTLNSNQTHTRTHTHTEEEER